MNKSNLQANSDDVSKWETPCLIDGHPDDNDQLQSQQQLEANAYSEGRKMGYQSGLEQAAKEMEEKLQLADTYLVSLSRPFQEQNQLLAEYIAVLAGKIAKSLVRRELRTEPETIMALVRDTVSALDTSSQKIAVHLNPENAQIIRSIVNTDSEEQNWSIIDDPLVSRSDCKVISQDSIVDADLQTRIDLIITQFLGDERSEGRT